MLEKKLIKKYWWAILSGNILAVILGLISTVLFTILGPSIQIYISPNEGGSIMLSSLLGEHYSQLIYSLFHVQSLPYDFFLYFSFATHNFFHLLLYGGC